MSTGSGEEREPRFWLTVEAPNAIWTSPTSFILLPKADAPAPTEPPDWTGWQELGYIDET